MIGQNGFTVDDLKLLYEKVGGNNFFEWLNQPLCGFNMQTPQTLINQDIKNIEMIMISLSHLLPKDK